jgi:acyl carrier protein phosphodiesterase
MGLQIKKFYEENVQTKPFHFVKIGIEIASDKTFTTPAEVEHASQVLNGMAKKIVRKELAQIKAESVE